MGTALQTFDVDATRLQVHLPQVGMGGSNDVLTTARITAAVQEASSEVCGVLVAAGFDPSAIAADTASIAYAMCQRIIVHLTIPILFRAVAGLQSNAISEIDAMEQRGRSMLQRIERNPAVLGWDDDTVTPGVYTTVSQYDGRDATDPVVNRRWQDYLDEPKRW